MAEVKLGNIFKVTFWKAVAIVLGLVSVYIAYIRYFHGLGYATHLNDQFPWGLWIGFDVISGVGLAAGGFTITALVYIFNIKKFKPILRSVVLTAFLGYVLVIVGLMFDLGKWYYVWHAIFYWNEHSVMLEVAWCVMLYTTVLLLEFSLTIFERMKWNKLVKIHHWLTPLLVTLGVMFSTLHQSSLGSLFLIEPQKLHPFWYTPWLPVLFFVSSIMVAFAMIIFESSMVSRFFKKGLEMDILVDIGRILMVMIVFYLVIRFETIWSQDALKYLTTLSKETILLLIEIGVGFVLPFILLSIKKVRHSPSGLFFSAVLVIFGFVSNRLNVTITGHEQAVGSSYFPSWMEFTVTATLIAVGFVVFGIAAHFLPIFPEGPLFDQKKKTEDKMHLPHRPMLEISYRSALMFGLLFLILVIVGFQVNKKKVTPATVAAQEATINPTILAERQSIKLPANFTFVKGEDSPGTVIFSHENHYDANTPNCTACHPQHFSFLEPGKSLEGSITMTTMGEGKNCGACHNGKSAFDAMSTDNCTVCHQAEVK